MLALRKLFLSGRALVLVGLWLLVVVWGSAQVARLGVIWDGSELALGDARALVAELAPGTRVTLVGDSSLERVVAPLARGTERLTLQRLESADGLENGDVQVLSGRHWIVLHQPDFDTLLWALALVNSPYAMEAVAPAPPVFEAQQGGAPEAAGSLTSPSRDTVIWWFLSGVLLPVVVCCLGLWWRWRRVGR